MKHHIIRIVGLALRACSLVAIAIAALLVLPWLATEFLPLPPPPDGESAVGAVRLMGMFGVASGIIGLVCRRLALALEKKREDDVTRSRAASWIIWPIYGAVAGALFGFFIAIGSTSYSASTFGGHEVRVFNIKVQTTSGPPGYKWRDRVHAFCIVLGACGGVGVAALIRRRGQKKARNGVRS